MSGRSHRLSRALTTLAALAACSRSPEAPPPPPKPPEVTCAQTSSCSQACPEKELAACVAECGARIGAKGKPLWEALQACSREHCTSQCVSPTAMSCKLCVMGNCAAHATACLAN